MYFAMELAEASVGHFLRHNLKNLHASKMHYFIWCVMLQTLLSTYVYHKYLGKNK
jgi:hypothetical protein